jgi:thiamine-monophosphate kinase
MTSPTISQLGELSLIDHIRRLYAQKSHEVPVGIGDDAAVIKSGAKYLLVTTDMMVEGVHFDLRFVTPYQLGFKLISVNVSDIFAMGGTPHYVLLNIAVPGHATAEFLHLFLIGVKDAMTLYHAVLVGGDLSSTKDGISLSATLIGSARKYILRSGARPGDSIYVTGNLGDAICGFHMLKKMKRTIPLDLKDARGYSSGIEGKRNGMNARSVRSGVSWKTIEPLLRRHLMPEARNPRKIVRYATSMIDISDGLLIDLTRLCNESGTGARIYEEKLPVSKGMQKAAKYLRMNPLKLALTGGEDYELLFTAPKQRKVMATYIGDITESRRVIVDSTGKERAFSAEGYEHFSS